MNKANTKFYQDMAIKLVHMVGRTMVKGYVYEYPWCTEDCDNFIGHVDVKAKGYGALVEFISKTHAKIVNDSAAAVMPSVTDEMVTPIGSYYDNRKDEIHLPAIDKFRDENGYAMAMLHELTHWTRESVRMNRWLEYGNEELVASLGAMYLYAKLFKDGEPKETIVDYVTNWVESNNSRPEDIMIAARYAALAVEYLNKLVKENANV